MKFIKTIYLTIFVLLISSTLPISEYTVTNGDIIDKTPSQRYENIQSSPDSSDTHVGTAMSLDSTPQEEPVTTNFIRNGEFSEFNTNGLPTGTVPFTTGLDTYQEYYTDDVHNGSYSLRLDSASNGQASNTMNLYQTIGPYGDHYLNESLVHSMWINMSNPGLQLGNTISVRHAFRNVTSSEYRWYFTYFSYAPTFTGENGSISYKLLLANATHNSWTYLEFNLTQIYLDIWGSINDMRLENIYFVIDTNEPLTDPSTLILDEMQISNSTGSTDYLKNGDFEEGITSWSAEKNAPTTITQAILPNQQSVLNMTGQAISTNSYGEARIEEYYFGSPTSRPHDLDGNFKIEMDWNLNVTRAGDFNQQTSIFLLYQNNTYVQYITYFLDYQLANIPGNFSNTGYGYTYVKSPNFRNYNTWKHEIIDMHQISQEIGIDMPLNYISIASSIGQEADSRFQFLLDNLTLMTYPNIDPGFEVDWYDTATNKAPIWNRLGNDYPMVNITNDSHSGTRALNITSEGVSSTTLYRNYNNYIPVEDDLLTDFWWRVDNFVGEGNTFMSIRLDLEGNKYLYYLFTENNYNVNSTSEVFYLINYDNQTGGYQNLVRDIRYDLFTAFGDLKFNITRLNIQFNVVSGGALSILLDDLHFIRDSHAPQVNSINFQDLPSYDQPTTLLFDISEVSQEAEVVLYYNNSGWNQVPAQYNGLLYLAEIPQFPLGTTIEYYLNATDRHGFMTIDDNGGLNYSFTIGDTVPPSVAIEDPLDLAYLTGNITLTVDAGDAVSSIGYIEVFANESLIMNFTSQPWTFTWNTRDVDNGDQILTAIAYDASGNSATHSITVTTENDLDAPVISNMAILPLLPETGDDLNFNITVTDTSGLSHVYFYYNLGSGWTSVEMDVNGDTYSTTLSHTLTSYGMTIECYFTAIDIFSQEQVDDNGGANYFLTIGDHTKPTISITSPTDTNVADEVQITIDAQDAESSIAFVEVTLDDELLVNFTSAPYAYSWNSRSVSNGNHEIAVTAYDLVGNMHTNSVSVITLNDFDAPSLSNLEVLPAAPKVNEDIEFRVKISDASDITTAELYYEYNGTWYSESLSLEGDNYTVTIDGIPESIQLHYYVSAEDIYGQGAHLGDQSSPFSVEISKDTSSNTSTDTSTDTSSDTSGDGTGGGTPLVPIVAGAAAVGAAAAGVIIIRRRR